MEKRLASELQIIDIKDRQAARAAMQSVKATARGIEIMQDKLVFKVIHVTNVDTRAANILKQSMLSQGGEAAVSAGTINLSQSYTDVILAGTLHQYRPVIERLKEQYWGLRELAVKLEKLLEI